MYLLNLNVVGIGIIKNSIHGVYEGKYVPSENWIWDYLLFWGITILLSVLMYKFIEIPFMRMRDSKKTSTSA
jgi:peptidoglycan/LPS O-acetylase OafA/YrhL